MNMKSKALSNAMDHMIIHEETELQHDDPTFEEEVSQSKNTTGSLIGVRRAVVTYRSQVDC